jgi:hypothetical protein
MLRMFGLGEGEKSEFGWGQESSGEDNVNVSLMCFSFVLLEDGSDITYQAGRGTDAIPPNIVLFPRWSSGLGDD